MTNNHTVLVCPRNDEESLQILKIAKAFNIATVISAQGHGAKLEFEPDIKDRIMKADPDASTVVIVEIPGLVKENELRESGLEVCVIDHHRYNDLDRLNDKSSLEQFLDYFQISDEELRNAGFDTVLIAAVAANDRGFLWELHKMGLSEQEEQRAIRYIKELVYELGFGDRKKEEDEAREAWNARREQDGFLIIESDNDEIDIRDAVSYLIFDEFKSPKPTIIKQGEYKLYVQETIKAQLLIEKYGGFLFGGGRCWGIVAEKDSKLPEIDEILKELH
jgi:hypothetical protein